MPRLRGESDSTTRRRRSECPCNEVGVLLARLVVEILHRRLNIRVSHPLLDAADVCFSDHARAERVPKIVEPKPAEAGDLESPLVSRTQGVAVDGQPRLPREDERVLAREGRALAESRERRGDIGSHGYRTDLAG